MRAKEVIKGLEVPMSEHPGDFRIAHRNDMQMVRSEGRMRYTAVAFFNVRAASKLGSGGYMCVSTVRASRCLGQDCGMVRISPRLTWWRCRTYLIC